MENKIRILTDHHGCEVGEDGVIISTADEKREPFGSVAEAEKAAKSEGIKTYCIAEVTGAHKIQTLRKNPTHLTRDVVKILKIIG